MVSADQCGLGDSRCSNNWSVVRLALADRDVSQAVEIRRNQCGGMATGNGCAFFASAVRGGDGLPDVWHLQRDETPEAKRLRAILIRLSGRQMKYGVESTAPALLAGLEKLLAIDDILEDEDLNEVLALARKVLPKLFHSG